MKKFTFMLLSLLMLVACNKTPMTADYRVVPLPQEITDNEGESFLLTRHTVITCDVQNEKMLRNAEFLSEFIEQSTKYRLDIKEKTTRKHIALELGLESDNKEAYLLTVNKDVITIKGATEAGVFYGIQTLRKAMPAEVTSGTPVEFKPVTINNYPRFGYRGLMLDVARHFATIDYVKHTLDIMALHNLNQLHFHLTDDQGWRVEIKKYPKLTEVGSIRYSTCIKGKAENQDSTIHQGFYTQEELRDLVAYAAERNINIIPEIDLPGHMLAALTSYPELGCTGGPYEVRTQWGVVDEVLCVGKEETMVFLEDVLSEIMDIFPSEYIHIGGDECPKKMWKNCPICQAKIKELGLKGDDHFSAEEYLQSTYVTERIERFVNSKGRRIIGWDEILEGKLAPNAIVMSWRGMDGGTKAAQKGHEVIMTPNTHLYFDYYQTRDIEDEQFAIGGFIDVERVYSFEPVPSILEESKHHLILGAQANLWAEYLSTPEEREYMILPRLAALSEVDWTAPEKKNYEDFIARLPRLIDIYNREHYTYAKHLFNVDLLINANIEKGVTEVRLSTLGDAEIRYTLDGSEPTATSPLYETPLEIKENCTLKCVAIRNGEFSKVNSQEFIANKATLKPITLTKPVHNNYAYIAPEILVDGMIGDPIFNSGKWIGYLGTDFQAIIDLKQPTEINSIVLDLLIEPGNYIFGAAALKIETSMDGNNFNTVFAQRYPNYDIWEHTGKVTEQVKAEFKPTTVQYVKVTAESVKHMPKWHGAAGEPAWIFVGEVRIN